MMFKETAIGWLEEICEKNSAFYRPSWNAVRCGKEFVLRQHMEVETQHSILSIKTKWGRKGIGAEYCYFALCEQLDDRTLDDYLSLLLQLEEADTNCEDPRHEYTFVSLVLVTNGFQDKNLQKKVKRFRSMTHYRKEDKQYGWSLSRVCVVDLSNKTMCWSAMGDPLRNRLADERFQRMSAADRLRKKVFS